MKREGHTGLKSPIRIARLRTLTLLWGPYPYHGEPLLKYDRRHAPFESFGALTKLG